MPNTRTLGETLRAIRTEQHGESLRVAAERIGVRFQQLARWEAGNDVPSLPNLPKLADYMGMKESQLRKMRAADILARTNDRKAASVSTETLTDLRKMMQQQAEHVNTLTVRISHLEQELADTKNTLEQQIAAVLHLVATTIAPPVHHDEPTASLGWAGVGALHLANTGR